MTRILRRTLAITQACATGHIAIGQVGCKNQVERISQYGASRE
jgi:hypothetical protein